MRPEVAEKLIARIKWWEHYAKVNNGEMNNNPSPGNKAGGLTTILEKSLGAVAKGGTSKLEAVYEYAEPVSAHGVVYMDMSGYDPVSATGQVAGGANVICFTTGRGSAYGCAPSPLLKLATNSALWQRQEEDMDINCGEIIDGSASIQEMGQRIFDRVLATATATASGEQSKSEQHGYGQNEFVPWQVGTVKKIVVDSCRRLPLSSTQRNLYAKAIGDFKMRADPSFRTPFKNHLGLLQYLRLVCTDPRRHGLSVFKPEPITQYRAGAPKLDWLLNQLGQIQAQGEKAIIFCEFRNIQRLLQHYIEEVFALQADIINGDTSASASHSASRQKRIKAFQAKPGFGVIILSPVAVGFGVNIQAANHVIHYTRTWNPAKEDQASDRAWRIGQTRDVYVYCPVVAAQDFTTFDVKLDQLLERKRSLASDMLNGSPDISLAEFKIEEVIPDADIASIDERVTLDLALRMDWRHFEGLAAALLCKRGFETVYCTPGSSDNGVDVVGIRGNLGELVQTKTSAADDRSLNWDTVKEVVAGEAFYRRRHPGVTFQKVGLTNQHFNVQAHENAMLNGVELIERQHLGEMLEKYPVTMLDVERLLYTEWSDADLHAF